MIIMIEETNNGLYLLKQELSLWERPTCEKLSISMTFADPTCADQSPPKSLGSGETFQITSTTSLVCGS